MDPIEALQELVDESESGELDNRDLWIEKSRAVIGSLGGPDADEYVQRFEHKVFPGLMHSDHTVRTGQYAAAEKAGVLRARSVLLAVQMKQSMHQTSQLEEQGQIETEASDGIDESVATPDQRTVFLVHGRDTENADAIRSVLRSLDLKVVEWEEAVAETEQPNPFIHHVVEMGLTMAHGVVVLLTPDDLVRLRPDLLTGTDDDNERLEHGQSRPNVIYETGLAQAWAPERTLVLSIGTVKGFSDFSGRHILRLSDTPESRHKLVGRLKLLGLDIDDSGTDWLSAGEFQVRDEIVELAQSSGAEVEPAGVVDGETQSRLPDLPACELEDEGELGYLELLVEMDDAQSRVNQAMQRMSEDTVIFGGITTEANEALHESDQRGRGNRGRLTVAISYARDLEPVVQRFESAAIEMSESVSAVRLGLAWIFEKIEEDGVTDGDVDTVLEALSNIESLGSTAASTLDSIGGFRDALGSLKDSARPVKRVLDRLEGAIDLVETSMTIYVSFGSKAANLVTSLKK